MNLAAHYDLLNKKSLEALQEDRYQVDHLIDSTSDHRFGITLLIRLNEPTKKKVQQFLSELKAIEPNQYYYPNSDLHVTVLSIISCYQGFELSDISIDQYIKLLVEVLQDFRALTIEFKGATFSKSGILIKGFPRAILNQMRDQLRGRFKESTLRHSIDSRYVLKTAHSTVMRFREPLRNKEELILKTTQHKHTYFGMLEVGAMELVFNDWYQRSSRTKTLQVIPLKAG